MATYVRQTLALALVTASFAPSAVAAQADSYTCEGSMSQIVRNDLTGEQRSEWPINFRMNVDRAAGNVMIFAVSGTSIIKAGRHTLAADQGRMALSWNWIDQANRSQPVTMTVSRDGEFSGAWNQSTPPFGDFLGIRIRGSFSGVCWQ